VDPLDVFSDISKGVNPFLAYFNIPSHGNFSLEVLYQVTWVFNGDFVHVYSICFDSSAKGQPKKYFSLLTLTILLAESNKVTPQ